MRRWLRQLWPDFQDRLVLLGLSMIGAGLYLAVGAWLALLVVGTVLLAGGVRPVGRRP